MSESKQISVVIPVYNSSDILLYLTQKLIEALKEYQFEIIYVNDCSKDDSWRVIKSIALNNSKVIGINLRKNSGQDCAIMAGFHQASGEVIIVMDDDLQHNPDDIPKLLISLADGIDVVYGNFIKKKQSLLKNIGSWINDKVANVVINKPTGIYLSPFKAIKKEIIQEVLKYDGPFPYIDGLIFRNTSNITQEDVIHHKRFMGKGNFTILKSLSVWARVVTNFSVFPLRIASYLGFFASIVGFLMGLFFIIQYFLGINSPQGWPSLIVTILFIGGIQLLSLGILGEYIGRSFLHQNKEPQFVIKETTHS